MNADPSLRKVRRGLRPKALALLSSGALILAGCGDSKTHTVTVTKSPAPELAQPSFKYSGHLRLPKRVIFSPREETPEGCSTSFYTSTHPEAPVREKPIEIVRVDGRCNSPLDSETVGVYPQPSQNGRPVFDLLNGDAVGVICSTKGEYIQDVNADGTAKWLAVVTARGDGFMPDTNAAFVSTPGVGNC